MKFKVEAILNAPSNKMFTGGRNPSVASYRGEHELKTPTDLDLLIKHFIMLNGLYFQIVRYSPETNKMLVRGNLPDRGYKDVLKELNKNGWTSEPHALAHYNITL